MFIGSNHKGVKIMSRPKIFNNFTVSIDPPENWPEEKEAALEIATERCDKMNVLLEKLGIIEYKFRPNSGYILDPGSDWPHWTCCPYTVRQPHQTNYILDHSFSFSLDYVAKSNEEQEAD